MHVCTYVCMLYSIGLPAAADRDIINTTNVTTTPPTSDDVITDDAITTDDPTSSEEIPTSSTDDSSSGGGNTVPEQSTPIVNISGSQVINHLSISTYCMHSSFIVAVTYIHTYVGSMKDDVHVIIIIASVVVSTIIAVII